MVDGGDAAELTECAPAQRVNPRRGELIACVLVGVVAMLVFLPSLRNGFVNWDDDQNFLKNPSYRGLGPANLAWMFTTFHFGPYQPLSWITLGADYLVWGIEPLGYHLTNIALHAIAAGLLCCVVMRLRERSAVSGQRSAGDSAVAGDTPAAGSLAFGGFVGLLWAVHPLRVEAVTWITERREVLCGVFTLWTLANHLGGGRWWSTALLAGAAMLAKGTAVTLPVLLIVIDLYQGMLRGRVAAADLARIVGRHAAPIFMAVVIALVAVVGQRHVHAAVDLGRLDLLDRIRLFGCGLAFYAEKTLWPVNLAPLYEAPRDRSLLNPLALAGGVGTALALVIAIIARRRWPALLPLTLAYIALVLPVGGLIQVGSQIAADRYSYQPGWAVTLAVCGILFCVMRQREAAAGRLGAIAMCVGGAAVLIALITQTISQQAIWHDTKSLWSYQLSKYPKTAIAHFGLGLEFDNNSRGPHDDAEAESHYRAAVAIFPDYVDAYEKLAGLMCRTRRLNESRQTYEQALAVYSKHLPSLNGLADVLWEMGRREEAIAQLRLLVGADPRSDLSHILLAKALAADGKPRDAVNEFQAALQAVPDSVEALKGLTLLLSTSFERSIRDGRRAIEYADRLLKLTHGRDGQAVLAAAAAYAEADEFERAVELVQEFARGASPEQAAALKGPLEQFRRREKIRMESMYP